MTRPQKPFFQRRTDARPLNEDGFTILEVLVALTILCLSASALFGVFSQALEQSRQDASTLQARTLIQSILAQERVSPSFVSKQGVTPSGITWRVQTARIPQDHSGPPSPLQRATIFVSAIWPVGSAVHTLTAETVVFVPPEKRP